MFWLKRWRPRDSWSSAPKRCWPRSPRRQVLSARCRPIGINGRTSGKPPQSSRPFDVGQAAVVASGFTLAIEAAEGTDGVLARCAALPVSARGGEKRNGVLVKMPKPGQERRVDLPTVGVETLKGAHAAGLAGIAVEAGATLVIDIDAVRREADSLSLFVYGFTLAELR
jgi:hypothetical protein